MPKATMKKESKKNKKIKELEEEIKRNNEVYRKIHEEFDEQVATGLRQLGFPPGVAWKETLEQLDLEISEYMLKLDKGFEMVSPIFKYETTKEWETHMIKATQFRKKTTEIRLAEIITKVEEVKDKILEQKARIELRKPDILDEMRKLDVDVSIYENKEKADYIG